MTEMKFKWGGMRRESALILKNHYEWCKKNGYHISWYKKKARGLRPMTPDASRQEKLSVRS